MPTHYPTLKRDELLELSDLVPDTSRIVASMATVPSRIDAMFWAVASLIDQVDELHVWLNGFDGHVPRFLITARDRGVRVWNADRDATDPGDAGKFFPHVEGPAYRLICDDDLKYPPDYAVRMVRGIEKYSRSAAVCLGGRIMPAEPVRTYYHDAAIRKLSVFETLAQDQLIHVPLTCVFAYHTDTASFSREEFAAPNMADIWAGIGLQHQRVPLVCLAHMGHYLEHLPIDQSATIYARHHRDDAYQTRVVNGWGRWTTFAPRQEAQP